MERSYVGEQKADKHLDSYYRLYEIFTLGAGEEMEVVGEVQARLSRRARQKGSRPEKSPRLGFEAPVEELPDELPLCEVALAHEVAVVPAKKEIAPRRALVGFAQKK